jgi:hypothetical protein
MADESGLIRRIAWEEVFPWVMLLRSLRLALSIPALFIATLGVLLMPVGWWAASLVLPAREAVENVPAAVRPLHPPTDSISLVRASSPTLAWPKETGDIVRPMVAACNTLVHPLRELLRIDITWHEVLYWGLGGLWNLLLWGLLGGVITRMAVMRYGRNEREGLSDALRFVRRRHHAFVGAPLFALSGVLAVVLLSVPVGWLMQQANEGVLISSLIWCFVLIGGTVTTVFIVGILLGWPLMWGALSAEEMGDIFEGAQRAYAYLYGRPLHYAFYAVVTLVVGSAAFYLVNVFAQLVIYCSMWAVAWGSGPEPFTRTLPTGSGPAVAGWAIMAWLHTLILSAAAAFRYSYLFVAAGVVYLLVRRDADRIEFDNVHVEDQQTRYGLPPLTADEAGVPQLADEEG